MAFEVITLGFDSANGGFHAEDLNRFCLNKRIKFQRVEFFADGQSAYLTVFAGIGEQGMGQIVDSYNVGGLS